MHVQIVTNVVTKANYTPLVLCCCFFYDLFSRSLHYSIITVVAVIVVIVIIVVVVLV